MYRNVFGMTLARIDGEIVSQIELAHSCTCHDPQYLLLHSSHVLLGRKISLTMH